MDIEFLLLSGDENLALLASGAECCLDLLCIIAIILKRYVHGREQGVLSVVNCNLRATLHCSLTKS